MEAIRTIMLMAAMVTSVTGYLHYIRGNDLFSTIQRLSYPATIGITMFVLRFGMLKDLPWFHWLAAFASNATSMWATTEA